MNILIDCGTNLCQGLKDMVNRKSIDNTWKIYCIEANPEACKHAERIIKSHFSALNVTLIHGAVTDHNNACALTMHVKDMGYIHHQVHSHLNYSQLSCIELNDERNYWVGLATNIMGDNHKPNVPEADLKKNVMHVPGVRLSDFVLRVSSASDNVIIKMDIEGAEYEALQDLVNSAACKHVRELYVEWHAGMRHVTPDQSSLEARLREQGVAIHSWS